MLPKALYGCETWFSLNTNNISLLERAHRFCVKYMQGLSIRTRTDAALSLLGIFSIESEIDLRKLTLFGQFCGNNMKCWVFGCFYRRLASYMVNQETQTGYFPDIYKIMRKYGLTEYFESYIRFNVFPSKNIWKRLVKSRIHDNEVNSWHNRLSAPDFNRFRQLHTDYSPHTLWIESKESRHLLPISRSCLQMIAGMAETTFSHPCCQFCNREIHINIIDHYVHSCSYLDAERVSLWYNILQLNDDVYVHLMNLDYAYVTLVLLGLEDNATSLLLGHQSQRFRYLCMSGLHKIWSKVSRYTH